MVVPMKVASGLHPKQVIYIYLYYIICIYIYIYTHIMYIYIYTYMYICILYIYIYICIYTRTFKYITNTSCSSPFNSHQITIFPGYQSPCAPGPYTGCEPSQCTVATGRPTRSGIRLRVFVEAGAREVPERRLEQCKAVEKRYSHGDWMWI